MEYQEKYVFGSEDSLDIDTCYVVKKIPQNCKEIVDSIKGENANFIVIKNGEITACYKGTCDEMNNCIMDTYSLHKQESPLLITHRLKRDITLKDIRATRGLLSYLSRTIYRPLVKHALRDGYGARLAALSKLKLNIIDFSILNKKFDGRSALKVLAFQIGQAMGLHQGKELYTKKDIATAYPLLKKYLYRETLDPSDLQVMLNEYLSILKKGFNYKDLNERVSRLGNEFWDMRKEVRIENYTDKGDKK